MGLKKITLYNKMDSSLKVSQIFGNTLEALVGAIYLDQGYKKTAKWVNECIIMPHMFMDDLENLEINHKNKLYGWANKNGRLLEFETLNERLENGRRLFTVAAVLDGENIGEGKAFNKKDASQIAAQVAVEKMGIVNSDSPGDEHKHEFGRTISGKSRRVDIFEHMHAIFGQQSLMDDERHIGLFKGNCLQRRRIRADHHHTQRCQIFGTFFSKPRLFVDEFFGIGCGHCHPAGVEQHDISLADGHACCFGSGVDIGLGEGGARFDRRLFVMLRHVQQHATRRGRQNIFGPEFDDTIRPVKLACRNAVIIAVVDAKMGEAIDLGSDANIGHQYVVMPSCLAGSD